MQPFWSQRETLEVVWPDLTWSAFEDTLEFEGVREQLLPSSLHAKGLAGGGNGRRRTPRACHDAQGGRWRRIARGLGARRPQGAPRGGPRGEEESRRQQVQVEERGGRGGAARGVCGGRGRERIVLHRRRVLTCGEGAEGQRWIRDRCMIKVVTLTQ